MLVAAALLAACAGVSDADDPRPALTVITMAAGDPAGTEAALTRLDADLAAVRETEDGAGWSGDARRVRGPGGTALIGRAPLGDPASVRFAGRPDEARAGFTVAAVELDGRELDVVCLRLHAGMAAMRTVEVEEMVGVLRERGRPLVVMGDLVAPWSAREPAARRLERDLGLAPREAKARRTVRILTSSELEIRTVQALPGRLAATISWRDE